MKIALHGKWSFCRRQDLDKQCEPTRRNHLGKRRRGVRDAASEDSHEPEAAEDNG